MESEMIANTTQEEKSEKIYFGGKYFCYADKKKSMRVYVKKKRVEWKNYSEKIIK